MKKICLIYNYAQHYRQSIFKLLDLNFEIDFYFGDKYHDVKKLDYNLLRKVTEVSNKTFITKPYYYQKNVLNLTSKYETFIILGDIHCISTWILLVIARLKRKKIFLWSHGFYGKENIIKTLLKKIFFDLSYGILLYGNYAKDLMMKTGIDKRKIYVVYNSLNYDDQLHLRKSLKETSIFKDHFKNNGKNLIFIGRITNVKSLDLLLSSLSILKDKGRIFNLTLIGEGTKINELITLANNLKLNENVWFYGACYDELIISEFIYNSDLCVSPGNVGLTAIHSLTYGTPVISHNNYKYQMPEFEVIDVGKTGCFFEYNNVFSLVENIENWFKNTLDRNQIRQNCYEIIDKKWNPIYQLEVITNALKLN